MQPAIEQNQEIARKPLNTAAIAIVVSVPGAPDCRGARFGFDHPQERRLTNGGHWPCLILDDQSKQSREAAAGCGDDRNRQSAPEACRLLPG